MYYRDRVRKSMEKYSKKHDGLKKKRTHTNVEGPVVLEIYNYLNSIGWSVDIVEAKGVHNESAGQYMHGKTRPGYPDISGNMQTGTAAYIEVKAPGKRSTLKEHQKKYLSEKIDTSCFAICADSVEYVKSLIQNWSKSDSYERKIRLMNELPISKHQDDDPLF